MKKTMLTAILTLFCVVCFGQTEGGPLKFLGIPIDGTKTQFAIKLRSKGFIYNTNSETYKGQFNGKDVDVIIHTNHNLVDRVYVAFPYTNEEGIRTEFNRLLRQFKDNGKYFSDITNEEITEKDDISFDIIVKKKRYEANFYYYNIDRDRIDFINVLIDKFSEFFSEEQLAILKEYAIKAIDATPEQKDALEEEMMGEMQAFMMRQVPNADVEPEKAIKFLTTFMDGMRSLADGNVWFMIHEHFGRYFVGLYYDNLHNQAHGEDL